jgi:hypothetical protein
MLKKLPCRVKSILLGDCERWGAIYARKMLYIWWGITFKFEAWCGWVKGFFFIFFPLQLLTRYKKLWYMELVCTTLDLNCEPTKQINEGSWSIPLPTLYMVVIIIIIIIIIIIMINCGHFSFRLATDEN